MNPDELRLEKAQLRRHFRQLRQCLPAEQRRAEAEALAARLAPWISGQLEAGARIGLYYPLSDELDPRPLLAALGPCYRYYLPRVEADGGLAFSPYDPGCGLEEQGYRQTPRGLWEASGRIMEEPELDLLLLPCLAVDRQGRRLGQGAGCYDRYLQAHTARGPRPLCLALILSCQLSVEKLPTGPWDQNLDGWVSAREFYWARG